jgi:CRP-like cAMP-binding protein
MRADDGSLHVEALEPEKGDVFTGTGPGVLKPGDYYIAVRGKDGDHALNFELKAEFVNCPNGREPLGAKQKAFGMAVLGVGGSFGDFSVLGDVPRACTATAHQGEVVVYAIDKDSFLQHTRGEYLSGVVTAIKRQTATWVRQIEAQQSLGAHSLSRAGSSLQGPNSLSRVTSGLQGGPNSLTRVGSGLQGSNSLSRKPSGLRVADSSQTAGSGLQDVLEVTQHKVSFALPRSPEGWSVSLESWSGSAERGRTEAFSVPTDRYIHA